MYALGEGLSHTRVSYMDKAKQFCWGFFFFYTEMLKVSPKNSKNHYRVLDLCIYA